MNESLIPDQRKMRAGDPDRPWWGLRVAEVQQGKEVACDGRMEHYSAGREPRFTGNDGCCERRLACPRHRVTAAA
ncbi:MAG TPA: hypothetical protein VGB12_13230, partial [bacterium]